MTTTPLLTAPRDAHSPLNERLEYLTDVRYSADGTEKRSRLAAYPRHTISYDVLIRTPEARLSLELLRSKTYVLAPLWQHLFERPKMAPEAGVSPVNGGLALMDDFGRIETAPDIFTWPTWAPYAAPLALARFAGDQRGIRYTPARGGAIAKAGLSLQLYDHHEDISAYSGPLSEGLPLLDVFTETAFDLQEQTAVNSNSFTQSWLDLYEARFFKRSYSMTIVLDSREKILAFRRLFFSLAGMLNPLRWKAPTDSTESTWRLTSDAVEINYRRPGFAQVSLSLTQL